MGGWSITLKGENDIGGDADQENLRSFARNITKAADAYGLGPSVVTLSPAEKGASGNVGVTPDGQTAEAKVVSAAKAEALAIETAKANAASAAAAAKADAKK